MGTCQPGGKHRKEAGPQTKKKLGKSVSTDASKGVQADSPDYPKSLIIKEEHPEDDIEEEEAEEEFAQFQL